LINRLAAGVGRYAASLDVPALLQQRADEVIE